MRPTLVGRDPARLEDMRFLLANPTASLYNNRTQVVAALEFACLDLLGQAWGVPVCDILGGRVRDRVPFASYLFFRYADATAQARFARLDQVVAHARALKQQYGFTHPQAERWRLSTRIRPRMLSRRRRRAPGRSVPIRSQRGLDHRAGDPLRARDRGLNNDYLEDPVFGLTGMRHAREKPSCAARDQHGRRELRAARGQRARTARSTSSCSTRRSGAEFAPASRRPASAKRSSSAWRSTHPASSESSWPRCCTWVRWCRTSSFAADAHYHHLADDIIEGGKLKYEDGAIAVPDGPGLGVRLDRDETARSTPSSIASLAITRTIRIPRRPGWAPLVPNDRWADPGDDREPFVRG